MPYIHFCSKFAIQLFRVTVANADIGSLKSLHTFRKKCLYQMLIKFEQNRIWSKLHEILSFLTKKKKKKPAGFYNHFWQRVDAILEDVSVAEIIV